MKIMPKTAERAMKRIPAPILLMTLLFPTVAFGETTLKDLVITNGLY